MIKMILVGVGGAGGSLARFYIGKYISEKSAKQIPIGTFVVNITGAILMGIVISSVETQSVQLLIADGFLGAYTTFSTFSYEGYMMFDEGDKLNSIYYLVFSVLIGVVGFFVGSVIGSFL